MSVQLAARAVKTWQLDANTSQTPGIRRLAAVSRDLAGYTCSLLRSISQRDLREWQPFVRPGDAVMDPRFLAAAERSMGGEAKFWNIVVRDRAGVPVAAAVLSLFPIDGLLFVQEPWKKWVQSLRQRFPRFLKVKVLLCGCPVSTGQSHLRFAPGSDHRAVLRLLDRLMTRVARAEGARFLVFKEFDEEEVGRCDGLNVEVGPCASVWASEVGNPARPPHLPRAIPVLALRASVFIALRKVQRGFGPTRARIPQLSYLERLQKTCICPSVAGRSSVARCSRLSRRTAARCPRGDQP